MSSHTSSVEEFGLPEQSSRPDWQLLTPLATGEPFALVEAGLLRDVTGDSHPSPDRTKVLSPQRRGLHTTGQIDAKLIEKAREIVDSIEPNDAFQTPLYLAALAGLLMEMWESAVDSSQIHRDILAALENAVRVQMAEATVTTNHVSAFREALTDLVQKDLVREHAKSIRSRFVRLGFGALGFVERDSDNASGDQ